MIGYLAFLDPPKKTAAAAIKALKEYGVAVKILTGDNEKVYKMYLPRSRPANNRYSYGQ